MKINRTFIISFFSFWFAALGFVAGYIAKDFLAYTSERWPILLQAHDILQMNGLKDIPAAPTLEYGMIRGMLQAYDDPYTIFVEPVQHELESNTLQGSFGGIGVRLARDGQGNLVMYPLPDSPALHAGVLEGDRLLTVEDLSIDLDTTMETIQASLRGPVGSHVKVSAASPPDYLARQISIERSEFPLPSVIGYLQADEKRLGVIEITVIAASTPGEINRAVEDLKGRGATAFVLDLRNNSGGLLESGVEVARLFLKDGIVIEQQYRGQEVKSYRVERPGPLADIPLVVLVNQHTASAAEIIAGAIQANRRASLIGTPTLGKDTIQLVFDLNDGSSLHVTAAHWWVPGLKISLAENGLQPNILLTIEQDQTDGRAIQLAIQELFGSPIP